MGQFGQEEKAKHAALAIGTEGDAGFFRGLCEAIDQRTGFGGQRIKKTGLGNFMQSGQTASGGHWVTAERACLVDRAQRSELFHHSAFATEGRQRHATTDDFAQHRDIWFKPRDGLGIHTLCAAQGHATTRHDFIEHQQRTMLCAEFAASLHERHAGTHEVHVASDGFDHQAGQLFAMQCKRFFQLGDVVVFEYQGVLHDFRWDTGTGGVAKSGQTRTCFHQQGVGMAVVAAFKFDDLAAACGTPCQAQCTHAGLGARADQTHHVHGGHEFEQGFDQFDFALCGCTKRKTIHRRFLHRLQHSRMTMTQDHGPP